MILDSTQFDPAAYGSAAMFALADDPATGFVWGGSAWVAYSTDAALLAGALTVTQSRPGLFTVAGPSGLPTGVNYRVTYYLRAGASPAVGDLQNPVGVGGPGATPTSGEGGGGSGGIIRQITDTERQITDTPG